MHLIHSNFCVLRETFWGNRQEMHFLSIINSLNEIFVNFFQTILCIIKNLLFYPQIGAITGPPVNIQHQLRICIQFEVRRLQDVQCLLTAIVVAKYWLIFGLEFQFSLEFICGISADWCFGEMAANIGKT